MMGFVDFYVLLTRSTGGSDFNYLGEERSYVSPSSSWWASLVFFIASRWFCLIAVYVVCSVVDDSVGVGVLLVVVGCLLFTISLSMEFPFQTALCCGEPSHVVCEIVVFATYFGSLWVLMSSSHVVAGLPRFQYPFCLVDIHFAVSLVQL